MHKSLANIDACGNQPRNQEYALAGNKMCKRSV